MRKLITLVLMLLPTAAAAQVTVYPPRWYNSTTSRGRPSIVKCDGTTITCSAISGGTLTLAAVGGGSSGTVTSIVIGNGMASTQSPLTTTGTLSVDLTYAFAWTAAHTQTVASVGTAQTLGYTLQNTTAALVGAQQYSPGLAILGKTWETTGPSSQTGGWVLQSQGFNSTVALSDLAFYSNGNGVLTKRLSFHPSSSAITIQPDVGQSGLIINSPSTNGTLVLLNSQVYLAVGSTELDINSGNVSPANDGAVSSGRASARWKGVMAGAAAASQPTCDSTTRGDMFPVFAANGASDTFQVCLKAAADTYAWRVLYTAP